MKWTDSVPKFLHFKNDFKFDVLHNCKGDMSLIACPTNLCASFPFVCVCVCVCVCVFNQTILPVIFFLFAYNIL